MHLDTFNAAVQHYQQGNMREAEALCRQTLQSQPRHAAAHHLMGILALQAGQRDAAIALIRRALALEPGNDDCHFNLGSIYMSQGRTTEAMACFQEAIRLNPGHAMAYCNLGSAFQGQGDLAMAAESFRGALVANPRLAAAHFNLGNVYKAQGHGAEAAQCYRQALTLDPNFADAWNNMGIVLKDAENLDEAGACFQQALRLVPHHPDAHNNLGLVLAARGATRQAESSFRHALDVNPNLVDAHINLGNVLKNQGQAEQAARCYEEALRISPVNADAHNNLGSILAEAGKIDAAIQCYRQAIHFHPAHVEALVNLGVALVHNGQSAEAAQLQRQALRINPRHAGAHNNLGLALVDQGQVAEGIDCYRKALSADPTLADAHYNLSVALTRLGHYDEAMQHAEAALAINADHGAALLERAKLRLLQGDLDGAGRDYALRSRMTRTAARTFAQPAWDGAPLDGKTILVYAEAGLGDTIQFVRYLPFVQERGGAVILECQPALLRLLRGIAGADHLVPAGAALPPFDVQASLLQLPGIFHRLLPTIPSAVPYVPVDRDLVDQWRRELANLHGFKIGLCWQGGAGNGADRFRSAPLSSFEPLARLEGVRFVSLQKGPGAEALRDWNQQRDNPERRILDLGERLDASGAFLDTAAVLMNLDLLLSVDTSVAHLAGALGVRTWLLSSLTPDLRWLVARDDAPWYPMTRLFRQVRYGDWNELLERVRDELRRTFLR